MQQIDKNQWDPHDSPDTPDNVQELVLDAPWLPEPLVAPLAAPSDLGQEPFLV